MKFWVLFYLFSILYIPNILDFVFANDNKNILTSTYFEDQLIFQNIISKPLSNFKLEQMSFQSIAFCYNNSTILEIEKEGINTTKDRNSGRSTKSGINILLLIILSILFTFMSILIFFHTKLKKIIKKLVNDNQRIEENKGFQALVFDSISEAMIFTDDAGKITQLNKAAERITGWQNEEVVGMDFDDFFNIYDLDKTTKANSPIKSVLDGKLFVKDNKKIYLTTRSSKFKLISFSADPIFNNQENIIGVVINISDDTEKNKQIEELKLHNQKLKAANKIGKIYYWQYNLNLDEYIGLENIFIDFGFELKQKLSASRFLEDFVPGEYWDLHNQVIANSIMQLTHFLIEYPIVINNSWIWAKVASLEYYVDENGHTILLGLVQDISDYKKREELQQEISKRLKLSMQFGNIGYWEHDISKKTINYLDDFWQTIHLDNSKLEGFSNSEEYFFSKIHKEDQQRIASLINGAINGEYDSYRAEFRIKPYGDTYIWLEIRSFSLRRNENGKSTKNIGFALNINKRKLKEIHLKETSAYLEQAANIAQICWWKYYPTEDKLVLSENAKTIHFGENIKEITFCDYINKFVIEENKKGLNQLRKISKSQFVKDTYSFNYRITFGGATKYIFTKGMKNFNSLEDSNYLFGIMQDITQTKLLEIDLIAQKEKAEESDKLKSAFIANISHEIRTPMNGILGNLQLLELTNSDPKSSNFINQAIESSNKLVVVIDSLIEIAKIETGNYKNHLTEFDFKSFIDEIYYEVSSTRVKENVNFIRNNKYEVSNIQINSDMCTIKKVLTNILDNAFKFTESGFIELGYKVEDKSIVCFVKDTGIGIPKEKHDLIFESFRQIETYLSRNYEGLGLGLAISKALAKKIDGTITVTSEPEKGSTFYLTIPKNEVRNIFEKPPTIVIK